MTSHGFERNHPGWHYENGNDFRKKAEYPKVAKKSRRRPAAGFSLCDLIV